MCTGFSESTKDGDAPRDQKYLETVSTTSSEEQNKETILEAH